MNYIDKYAYYSRLRKTEPVIKILFALLMLGICILANNAVVSFCVLILMSAITVAVGKTPFGVYIKLMLLPLSFLILGVITIIFDFSGEKEAYYFSISIYEALVGVSRSGVYQGTQIFFKSFAAISCLYFLSLSTPMVDLLVGLRKLKVPSFLVEIMGLIYRFIFVLLEMSEKIFVAQNSRLGYVSIKASLRALASLSATLLIRSLKKSENVYTAMEARGYDGEVKVLSQDYKKVVM